MPTAVTEWPLAGFLVGEDAPDSGGRQSAEVLAETHDQKAGRLHDGSRLPVVPSQTHKNHRIAVSAEVR